MPLKEAPNVLAKCVLAYTQVCTHSLVGCCLAPEILMALFKLIGAVERGFAAGNLLFVPS